MHGPRIAITPGQEFFELQHFRDLRAHSHQGVEGRHWLLEDHGNLVATDALHLSGRLRQQVLALPKHVARNFCRLQQTQDRQRSDRLA